MRVMLCYYFTSQSIPLGEDLAKGFVAAGHTVSRFDSSIRIQFGRGWKLAKSLAKLFGKKKAVAALHERLLSEQLAARFAEAAGDCQPNLVVVIQGERIPAQAVKAVCRTYGAKSVLWWVKPPRWQGSIYEDRAYYDAVCTIDGSSAVDGIDHLPSWAVNRETYYPGSFGDKVQELLFVGSWSPQRQAFLETIADLPLKIVGGGWKKRLAASHPLLDKISEQWVGGTELADAYRRAWAVIDIPQFVQGEGQGVNMRFADVPACGTVMLAQRVEELVTWFEPGANVLAYEKLSDFESMARALLCDPECVRRISEAGVEVAAKMPTFADRAKHLVRLVFKADAL